MQPDGDLRFLRAAFQTHALADESDAFFMRTIDPGFTSFQGACLGRLTVRGRLMDDSHRLTSRATAFIRGFRQLFDSSLELGRPSSHPAE